MIISVTMACCLSYARPPFPRCQRLTHGPQTNMSPGMFYHQQLRGGMYKHLRNTSKPPIGTLAQLGSRTAVSSVDTWEQNREEWVHLEDSTGDATIAPESISWDELWYSLVLGGRMSVRVVRACQNIFLTYANSLFDCKDRGLIKGTRSFYQ
jgi:hypothetical protein